jgi:hypothetical protein
LAGWRKRLSRSTVKRRSGLRLGRRDSCCSPNLLRPPLGVGLSSVSYPMVVNLSCACSRAGAARRLFAPCPSSAPWCWRSSCCHRQNSAWSEKGSGAPQRPAFVGLAKRQRAASPDVKPDEGLTARRDPGARRTRHRHLRWSRRRERLQRYSLRSYWVRVGSTVQSSLCSQPERKHMPGQSNLSLG